MALPCPAKSFPRGACARCSAVAQPIGALNPKPCIRSGPYLSRWAGYWGSFLFPPPQSPGLHSLASPACRNETFMMQSRGKAGETSVSLPVEHLCWVNPACYLISLIRIANSRASHSSGLLPNRADLEGNKSFHEAPTLCHDLLWLIGSLCLPKPYLPVWCRTLVKLLHGIENSQCGKPGLADMKRMSLKWPKAFIIFAELCQCAQVLKWFSLSKDKILQSESTTKPWGMKPTLLLLPKPHQYPYSQQRLCPETYKLHYLLQWSCQTLGKRKEKKKKKGFFC